MKFRPFPFFLFVLTCLNAQAQKGILYNEVPAQSFILLTDRLHDSWPVWSPDNKTIYTVDFSGNGITNIFALSLDSMTFVPDDRRLYVASYSGQGAYRQITFFEKGLVDSPVLSPDGKKMAFRKDGKYLLEFDLDKGTHDTLLREEVHAFDYKANDHIVYALASGTGNLVEMDLKSGQAAILYSAASNPLSIVAHNDEMFLTFGDSVLVMDKNSFKFKASFGVKFTGTRIGRVDTENFVMTVPTPNGPASAIYNTTTNRSKLLMHSYDYEPVLAPGKAAIVFLSEGANGMVLCKLK